MPVDDKQIIIRLFLAFMVGALIGAERKIMHKPAGMRTHALVGLGAALFTIVSIYGFLEFDGPPYYRTNMDPARVAAQIVVGVSFIGGGLIFREENKVKGLTTAASIWLTAALGTAIGVGMYLAVFVATVLGFISLKLNRLLKIGEDEHYE
jgi:putative Mg2+ transporter-C (MgtC) family protein